MVWYGYGIYNVGQKINRSRIITYSTPLSPHSKFGSSMTFIGDLNGDGVLDMAVGADGDDDGKARSGAVYVLVKTLSS